MTFLKKIAGTNGHSKNGSASNIRHSTISQPSPSTSLSSFKTHVRNSSATTEYSGSTYGYSNNNNSNNNNGQSTPLSSKNSSKTLTPTTYRGSTIESPHSMTYRGSTHSADTYNSGFSTPTFDISETPSKPSMLGDGLYSNNSSDSRKSSGGSNSLAFDKLILSWDPTNPEEWTMQRVLSWFKYHEFPENWINFFKKYQIYGQKFIRLLAYENFALYEKYLTISKYGSYDRFQSLLKQTMAKNVSHSHSRQKSGNSISSMQIEPMDSVKMRHKNSKSQDDITTSRSTSESVLLGNDISSLSRPPEKAIAKSHKKTKSTGSLYRRSFISLIGSSAPQPSVSNSNNPKPNPNIKLHIPSRPQSITESDIGTAKVLSPSNSPTYSGLLKKHQKSSSSESSLLNAIFANADDKDKRGNISTVPSNGNKRHENTSSSTSNVAKNNESTMTSHKPSANQSDDKSTLWGKIKRKSQTISPSTPSFSNSAGNHSSRQKTNRQAPGKTIDIPRSSIETLTRATVEHETREIKKADKDNKTAFQYGEYMLEKKFYPYKNKTSGESDDYILITKDNTNFIPINITDIPTSTEKFKEYLAKKMGISGNNFTIHMTDFGCDIGAALTDQLIDTVKNSLFLNTSRKFYLKDQNHAKTSSSGMYAAETSQKERLRKKSSTRSITSSILNSTEEISNVTSSSDIASFDDRSSAPGRQYPQTPSYFYDTGNNHNNTTNNTEEINYWNVKDHLPDSVNASKLGSKVSPQFSLYLPDKKKKASEDLQKNSFQILRKDEGKEIDFNKRRRSPYTNPELAPKRDAPKPPINVSPQKSVLQQSTNSPRRKTTLESRKRPELKSNTSSPIETTSPSSDKMVSSYTPGSSHVLVPQPYKGAGESQRKSKLDEETIPPLNFQNITKNRVNRSSSSVSNNSIFYSPSPMLKRGNSRRIVSSASAADVFEENTISFNDVPELSDSEDNDNSSEDILWGPNNGDDEGNKVSSVSRSNSEEEDMIYSIEDSDKPIRKMTLRPTAEMVYQNLERFFPRAHLDKPVVEDISNSKSPISKTPDKTGFPDSVGRSFTSSGVESNSESSDSYRKSVSKLPRRTRTIRAIAHEAREARKNTIKLRRRNTKMWGTRIVEVTEKNLVEINKAKNSNGEYKEFAWIKGEMIGKGSFGAVYLSFNVTTGEMMAVKQVEVPKYSSQNQMVKDMVDALKSEVATLKDLDHLNIVQYLGSEIRGNIYSLFLEYVAGGSVGSLIRLYGRFDEPLIRHLNIQVLKGLAYLHSKGILHRDMKADNLLLDQDGVCKISDFGISKKSKDIYSNSDMTMRGTVFWMAPEMVDTKQGYSAKVDIWSLGCVVLEMFAGKRPWSNLEVVAAMFKIGKAKSAPPIPEDVYPLISTSGKQFLDCCFQIDPEKRPTAGDLLNHSFSTIDPSFDFTKTSLYEFIKSNDKLNSSILRKK